MYKRQILSDPKVGVPTPMLIQWPDKYYHTSGDVPENISAELLSKIGVIAATYAYLCAAGDEEDVASFVKLTGQGLRKTAIERIGNFYESGASSWITPQFYARKLLRSAVQALRSAEWLCPHSRLVASTVRLEQKTVRQCIQRELKNLLSYRRLRPHPGREEHHRIKFGDLVVRRLMPGPVDVRAILQQTTSQTRKRYLKYSQKRKNSSLMEMLALFAANGKRSIAEISRLVAVEVGDTDPELIRSYFNLLEEANIVEIRRR